MQVPGDWHSIVPILPPAVLGVEMVAGLGQGDLSGNMQGYKTGNRPLKKV